MPAVIAAFMRGLRATSRRGYAWALLCVMLALASRVIVPAGFMPQAVGRTITLALCSGHGPLTLRLSADTREPGSHKPADRAHEAPCGFGSASASLGGADLVPLVATVIATIALVIASWVCPPPPRARRLRPPSRGPPAAPSILSS